MPAPSPAAVVPTPATTKAKLKPRRGRKWLWVVIASVVLGAGGGGWWWWQQAQATSAQVGKQPIVATVRLQARYFALEPAFVVNLTDEESVRYLQADLQLMTRDDATLAAFATHAPAIRNAAARNACRKPRSPKCVSCSRAKVHRTRSKRLFSPAW